MAGAVWPEDLESRYSDRRSGFSQASMEASSQLPPAGVASAHSGSLVAATQKTVSSPGIANTRSTSSSAKPASSKCARALAHAASTCAGSMNESDDSPEKRSLGSSARDDPSAGSAEPSAADAPDWPAASCCPAGGWARSDMQDPAATQARKAASTAAQSRAYARRRLSSGMRSSAAAALDAVLARSAPPFGGIP